MNALPSRPDLRQLRRRAKELLRAAKGGDDAARARIQAVEGSLDLASAQLTVAREYGFASWEKLRTEVTRREILDDGDVTALARLLGAHPGLATQGMERWRDHPLGASPLGYVAMLRYDTHAGVWRDVPGTAALARALLAAGAPVDGGVVGDGETPLISAASYGDAEVARVLIGAGAGLERVAAPHDGGVPGGTALLHAAVFGMTAVLDVLVAAGAVVPNLVQAAAVGDLGEHDPGAADPVARTLALVMAARHGRLEIIDRLVAAGASLDDADPHWGQRPLHTAAGHGQAHAVERLLILGADPVAVDGEGRTALGLSRIEARAHPTDPGYAAVQALLAATGRT